jgi:trehalose 6-phosphate synthase/phosphatase
MRSTQWTPPFNAQVVVDRIPRPSIHARICFLLDKDGTLDPTVDDPMKALVPVALARILEIMSRKAGISVNIVSGRDIPTLKALCGPLAASPHVTFIGVHGSQIERDGLVHNRGVPDQDKETLQATIRDMSEGVVGFFRDKGLTLAIDAPGANAPYLEFKPPYSLVVHWKRCPHLADRAQGAFREFVAQQRGSQPELKHLELHAGDNVLELKPNTSKGDAASEILARVKPAFVVCAGDDRTDDAMFRAVAQSRIDHLILPVGPREPECPLDPNSVVKVPDPKSLGEVISCYARRVFNDQQPE